MACHSVDPTNKVGPSLQNVVGRPVATVEGFRYSMTELAPHIQKIGTRGAEATRKAEKKQKLDKTEAKFKVDPKLKH